MFASAYLRGGGLVATAYGNRRIPPDDFMMTMILPTTCEEKKQEMNYTADFSYRGYDHGSKEAQEEEEMDCRGWAGRCWLKQKHFVIDESCHHLLDYIAYKR